MHMQITIRTDGSRRLFLQRLASPSHRLVTATSGWQSVRSAYLRGHKRCQCLVQLRVLIGANLGRKGSQWRPHRCPATLAAQPHANRGRTHDVSSTCRGQGRWRHGSAPTTATHGLLPHSPRTRLLRLQRFVRITRIPYPRGCTYHDDGGSRGGEHTRQRRRRHQPNPLQLHSPQRSPSETSIGSVTKNIA